MSEILKLPIISQKAPYKVHVKKGVRYSWCSCGLTKTEPFCDGAHKLVKTELKSVKFEVDEDKVVSLCGCKHSKNMPFCDNTHNFL